jgi:hypothetical protein
VSFEVSPELGAMGWTMLGIALLLVVLIATAAVNVIRRR